MAKVIYKEFPRIGTGFTITTSSMSIAGLVMVLRASREGERNFFRYSLDDGKTFTDWDILNSEVLPSLGKLTETRPVILDFVTTPFDPEINVLAQSLDISTSSIIYDKSIFKMFFNSSDPEVLGWAMNVLEKLFEPNIVPLYVSRNHQDDYNTFFLTITHFFAFIVIYARQFRYLENSDLLMKEFIEGWGLVYENIDTSGQRAFLFKNWINQFRDRGTFNVVETETVDGSGQIIQLNGEIRRIVGYVKPSEFIFGVLAPQDMGWCMGWSSPMWFGTETINAVSKGYDYGLDYAGDHTAKAIEFSENALQMVNVGSKVTNDIYTKYPWKLYIDNDAPVDFEDASSAGVGPTRDYPILGEVQRKFVDNAFVFQFNGTGRVGITTEADTSKAMEVYAGMDYEVTVWVQALSTAPQNIEFGVNCYDANMKLLTQVRLTDLSETNSFFEGDRYQSPCKVPNIYYRLRGIIYNLLEERQPELYLNFENGKPLRFLSSDVKYMAPYIVQNRTGSVSDLYIAGVVLKPLNLKVEYTLFENKSVAEPLPYPAKEYSFQKDGNQVVLRACPISQGYLGQKNVIVMYSQIKSARTKKDIESFVRRYLVSYKNVMSYTWLDWVTRTSWFLTFNVSKQMDGSQIEGAEVTIIVNDTETFTGQTDENGYVRFEVPFDSNVVWKVVKEEAMQQGTVVMDQDKTINVVLNIPLHVYVTVIQPTWGTVTVEGSRLPRTEVTLTATPAPGYVFIKYVIHPEEAVDTRNPTNYWLSNHDIYVDAYFERGGEISFDPTTVTIPAMGGTVNGKVLSTKKWQIHNVPDWLQITPTEGNGDTVIQIKPIKEV